MAGSVVLIVAGLLSTVVGNATDTDTLAAHDYQTISESYSSDGSTTVGSVDVSRDFDRASFNKQSKAQAAQTETAVKQLAAKVDATGAEVKRNQWVLPVTGYHLSARFGQRSGLWANSHTGLDFAGPSGSTIVSVAAGTVISTGYEGAYGNRTIIRLNDGTDIWYCHQSRIVVSPGQKVAPGEVIGYTGSTGNVTGPHLHLEVRPGGGAPVDPYTALRAHSVTP
ncbi:MAG TPA: M23 family metallopeptidase [Aeromicrobium sp.]|nr:M23 family metallopeptidase [Aeromicrobium sp.]